jgi:hypothetical protein
MSDQPPNLPPDPERVRNTYRLYMDSDNTGRGLTLIVGILVAIALAAGLLFFAGPTGGRVEQAEVPRTQAAPGTPSPATPAPAPSPPAPSRP